MSEADDQVVEQMSTPNRASSGIGGAETARRATMLLEVVAGEQGPISLEQVVDRVGLPKSITYRLLRALQDEGWLERSGRSGYRVGGRLVRLAAAVGPGRDLAERAQPFLESLADITSETCTFHVLDGQYAVLAAGAESQAHALRLSALVGERTPLTRGCAGMVILAQLDLAGRESIFRRMAQANATVASDIRTFDESLRESGRSGYAFSFGENHAGVAGMAAPVFRGAHGEVLASIAVSGPDGRWTQTAMESALPELLSTCKELSTALAVDLDYEDAPATTATERISS